MNNIINKILVPFVLLSLWAVSLNAQVKGTVKDEHGRILQGVIVASENGRNTAATDKNGRYEMLIDDGSLKVNFSLKGYVSQNLTVGSDSLNVTLERAETYDLDEQVLFGNYAQRKGDVTGSVACVTGEELRRSPVGNLSMSLAGRLPGLFTRETYSEPARTNTQLFVRGASSPNGGTAVIVIDGFVYDYNANQLFEYITANEVESVTVLKDASAQALYGINGANGVIVITTKRGIKQPLKIEVELNHTLEQRTTTPPHISSADFVQMRNQAGFNDGNGEYSYFSRTAVEGFIAGASGENPEYFPDNNWVKMNAKDITQMSRINMNVTGGSDKVVFYTNVNVLHQDGMWKVDPATTDYNPNNMFLWSNIRSNIDVKLTKHLSIGLNLSGNIKRERTPGGKGVELGYGGSWDGFANRIWYRFFTLPPYVYGPKTPLVQDPETGEITGGEVVVTETEPITSWALINRLGYDQYTVTNIYAQFAPKLDLSFITPGLSISGSYGYQTNSVKGLFVNRTYEEWVRTRDYTELEFQKIRTNVNSPLQYRSSTSFYYNLNYKGLVNYHRRFAGVHDISAMAYSFYQHLNKTGDALPYKRFNSGVEVAYGYDDRYLVKFDLGYSGSEQYSSVNRFAAFPAVSAGWVASNESFLKDQDILTYLKLRASWGKAGNDRNIGRYVYLDNVTLTGGGMGFLGGYNVNEGQVANPYLDPEIITKKNLGLDLTLFNNVSLTFDIYNEKTENGVTSATSKTPEYQGVPLGYYPRTNVGIFENKGYEIALDFNKDLTRNLNIFVGGWLAYNKNKVIFWDESERAEDYAYPIRTEGYPLGQAWGYLVDDHNGNGYFNSQEEIDNSGLVYEIGAPRPGYLKYYDLNADGKINDKDVAPLGHGSLPNFFYAFHGGFRYKNFDMNILFQGIADYWVVDAGLGRTEFAFEGVYSEWHKTAWTAERYANGEKITYPALSGVKNSNHESSNFFLEDKSYLRLKNLEVGYTFNMFNGLRLYLSGHNLFTWDKLEHDLYGPEGHYSGGIEGIPVYRLYNVGVNVKF